MSLPMIGSRWTPGALKSFVVDSVTPSGAVLLRREGGVDDGARYPALRWPDGWHPAPPLVIPPPVIDETPSYVEPADITATRCPCCRRLPGEEHDARRHLDSEKSRAESAKIERDRVLFGVGFGRVTDDGIERVDPRDVPRDVVEWTPATLLDRILTAIADPEEPTASTITQFVRDYYAIEGNECGGSLHVVLDDGNVDDHSVQFCIEYAEKKGDRTGAALGRLLLRVGEERRDGAARC